MPCRAVPCRAVPCRAVPSRTVAARPARLGSAARGRPAPARAAISGPGRPPGASPRRSGARRARAPASRRLAAPKALRARRAVAGHVRLRTEPPWRTPFLRRVRLGDAAAYSAERVETGAAETRDSAAVRPRIVLLGNLKEPHSIRNRACWAISAPWSQVSNRRSCSGSVAIAAVIASRAAAAP